MPILEFQHVSFSDQEKVILEDISFGVDAGDFISIVGASGSGKSTIFKLCSNLMNPTKGDIFFNGKNMREVSPLEWRQQIAYCFQTPYLFGDKVMENMAFPYTIRKLTPDVHRMKELLSSFHMSENYLERDIQTLSGGEKQRLALVRSLLFLPTILLLDEVTSALDGENTLVVEQVLETLHKEGMTILWVTHNLEQSK